MGHVTGLLPGQRVLTAFGYRALTDLEVGDAVVSGRGRLRLVVRTGSRTLGGALYRLVTEGDHVLRVGSDQPVLGRRDDEPPRWWPARDLRPRDAVATLGGASRAWDWRRPHPRADGDGSLVLHEEQTLYASLDWVPLVAADAAPYAGQVCGLEVEDDRNCVVEGVVVTACLPDAPGRRGE